MKAHIEFYIDKRGEHRARIKHANGRKTYSTQGYKNKKDLIETMFIDMSVIQEYFNDNPNG